MPSYYVPVDVMMWNDEKFRALSSPKPNGQSLWIYLLTGPHNIESLPGLFNLGKATLAEKIGWTEEATVKLMGDLKKKRMAAFDWNLQVIHLPNAIWYRPPANPNILKHWGKIFEMIPACGLKDIWLADLKAWLNETGKAGGKLPADFSGHSKRRARK